MNAPASDSSQGVNTATHTAACVISLSTCFRILKEEAPYVGGWNKQKERKSEINADIPCDVSVTDRDPLVLKEMFKSELKGNV